MAAIGRSAAWLVLLLVCQFSVCRADQSAEARQCVGSIATALTAGNAADAMGSFDKSFADYEKLSGYFMALTSAFQVASEIDVTNEEDSATETKLTIRWTLTLTDAKSQHAGNRSGDLDVKLIRKGKKWKIVDFSPIEFFNPGSAQ